MALTPKYLQDCTDQIDEDFRQLVTDILVDMAKRIKKADGMTSTTEYLNQKLQMMSLQQTQVNKALAKTLNTTEKEVEKLMEESTAKSTRSTMTALKKHGYDTSGLSFREQILKSTNVAKNELTNLTRTTGQLATSKMMNIYDQAYLQVTSGAYSLDQAVTNAVKKLANEGLDKVEYPTGAKRSVEAAVSVAVRTSVAQNALQCEEDMLDEMDINLVEVSSHMGARPSHAVWQGKVFWRKHPEGNYQNFYDATGYGTTTGLGGYNCRHQFYAFFGEDDEQTYEHIDETTNNKAYEMEQKQRSLERKLREWDRKKKILEAGGQDTTEATRWKRYYQEQIKNLVDSSDGFLKRNYSAEKANSGIYKDTTYGKNTTPDWTKKEKTGSVSESQTFTDEAGNIYTVDGLNVQLDPSQEEKEVAKWLAKRYGKTVILIPRVNKPEGVSTPDYLIDGKRYDLKSPTGSSKGTLYNLLKRKKRQSSRFIFNLSNCPLTMEEIREQVNTIFNKEKTKFVKEIIIYKDTKVLEVYTKKRD